MNDVTMHIWGREVTLAIRYRMYKGQSVTDEQQQALCQFCKSSESVDQALAQVIYYLEHHYSELLNEKIHNIFRYVVPKTIYIPKQRDSICVALLCDFRFDPEHGLALVFKDNCLSEIGDQDIIL